MHATIGNALLPKLTPCSKPYDVRDNKLTGFLIRVNISGKLVYMCEYARGKRIMLGKVGVLTPTQARDMAKEVLANYVRGVDPSASKKDKNPSSLSSYIENEYAPWFKASRKSAKSLDNLKHFIKDFGDKALAEITPLLLEKWRTKRLEAGKLPTTINRNITALKASLAKAVEWEFIDTHPLIKLKLSRIDHTGKLRYLTKDEETRLREAVDTREEKIRKDRDTANQWRAKRNYDLYPDLRQQTFADYMKPMILISLNTGMRKGELLSLTWDKVNFDLALLSVAGETAKSGKTRHIPLNDEALTTLKNWRAQTTGQTLVFSNRDGNQFGEIKKSWATILKIAEIDNFRWHDLRHHFASRLAMAGVDLNTIRELLGHSDIKMTLRYAHLAPEHKADAVAKLGNARIT
jgi:integrase